ncbi:MAG: efflux RND transporter periplasmic adaptor subunit [Phycisphaera sp.]|nr:efflux RND transporter periplasmic adaptor subunit [Phycisphaera sp.]
MVGKMKRKTVRLNVAVASAFALVCMVAGAVALAQDAKKPGDSKDDKATKAPAQQGPPPASVRVAAVAQEELVQQWPVIGRLREVRRVIVSAEQQGKLVEVNAEEGHRVVGGQTVLARIEDVWADLDLESAKASLDQANASVLEAQANLKQATSDRKYLEELSARGSATPKELDDARTTEQARAASLEVARARVTQATAELDRMKTEKAKLVVMAPFDGVVIRKIAEVGQYATRGSQVAEVVSTGQIDAVIDVPERLVNFINDVQDVEVYVEPIQKSVTGKVFALVPDGTAQARTFPVKVRLDDLEGALKPGMSVTAHMPTGEKAMVLTVPRDAVSRSATGSQVWVAVNGIALPIPVDVLFGHGDSLAIKASPANAGPPLMPGMQVVIEGAERLFPTRPLMIQPVAQANTDNSAPQAN